MAKKCLMIKARRQPKYKVRGYHRCQLCGRPRSYMRDFGLCRLCFRKYAHQGLIPGVYKASW